MRSAVPIIHRFAIGNFRFRFPDNGANPGADVGTDDLHDHKPASY